MRVNCDLCHAEIDGEEEIKDAQRKIDKVNFFCCAECWSLYQEDIGSRADWFVEWLEETGAEARLERREKSHALDWKDAELGKYDMSDNQEYLETIPGDIEVTFKPGTPAHMLEQLDRLIKALRRADEIGVTPTQRAYLWALWLDVSDTYTEEHKYGFKLSNKDKLDAWNENYRRPLGLTTARKARTFRDASYEGRMLVRKLEKEGKLK